MGKKEAKEFTVLASYHLMPDGTKKPLGAGLVILKSDEHVETIKGKGCDYYEVVVRNKEVI